MEPSILTPEASGTAQSPGHRVLVPPTGPSIHARPSVVRYSQGDMRGPTSSGAFVLRPATYADVPAIVALLEASRLPAAELERHLDNFVVAEAGGRLVGCGGLEVYVEASAGLVRSMAVEEALRGRGLGTQLLDWPGLRAMARPASPTPPA